MEKYNTDILNAPEANILVVDDTEINFRVIIKLLKNTKIQIDTAGSGKEALIKALGNHYDLFLIDYMMPEMNGTETLKALKELSNQKAEQNTSPVYIVLTADTTDDAREKYIEEGFDDFISKPVTGKRLAEILQSYLPKEKLLPETAGTAEDNSLAEALPEWLKSIPDLDISLGIENCGSPNSYLSILDVFRQSAPLKATEIRNLFDTGDYTNYTIKVHALKSSARIIGAKKLSLMAEVLENAGKSGDIDTIQKNTDELLSKYFSLSESLTRLVPHKESLKELDPLMRKDAFRTISETADSMDYGMMEDIIKELRKYKLSDEDEKTVSYIADSLMNLDWDNIKSVSSRFID